MVRLILFLLILIGLTLFTLQNWSFSLPLVFLGLQSQSLPLAVWVLAAIAAGATTTLILSLLLRVSTYFSLGPVKRKVRWRGDDRPSPGFRSRAPQPSSPPADSSPPRSQVDSEAATSDRARVVDRTGADEDYFDEDLIDEEDDFVDQMDPAPRRSSPRSPHQTTAKPRVAAKPRDDSGYSYSYRDPANFGAGRREAVYDAEYRVIVPPHNVREDSIPKPPPSYSPPPPPQRTASSDEEDWGFDFDDNEEFVDEEPNRRSH
ncbi:hypothetical protein [Leptolyngbya sp. 'hensonii']|uniref:hypothetical protein n=1 Tax=Leptolyngbya sp. 'hensonii' TaxID=1922337 RepID=UPI000B243C5B|nr:hypothetical protein [Leptolyngbya sp. 'hensonii']